MVGASSPSSLLTIPRDGALVLKVGYPRVSGPMYRLSSIHPSGILLAEDWFVNAVSISLGSNQPE